MLDRLTIKELLLHRGIISDSDSSCVFCFVNVENMFHLFFSFPVVCSVWRKLGFWLDFVFADHIYQTLSLSLCWGKLQKDFDKNKGGCFG